MHRSLKLAALALLLIAPITLAEDAPTPVTVLPNGLTVIVKENRAAPVCSVRVVVRTGSMLEGEHLGAGISHLTEHLVSGGTTRRRSEAAYEKILDRLGSNNNAMTSVAWTQYFIDTTGENVFEAIDVLSEWMTVPSIAHHEFYREKGVVTRELERNMDNAERLMHQYASQNLFKVHPSRHPVIGYPERLKKITRQNVVDYTKRMYVPNNMIFVVVGDFDGEKVRAHIAQAFAKAETRPVPVSVLPEEPGQVAPRRVIHRNAGIAGGRLRVDFPTIPLMHPDLYPLDVLSYILSQGNSSRLVQRLREEKQLVQRITTWSATPHYGGGYFAVYAHVEPEKVAAAEAAILAELERLKTELVSDAELTKAKTQKITDHVFSQQTVGSQAEELALNYLATYDPDFGKHYTENIQKVTAEEVREVARKYFRLEKLCATALLPDAKDTAGTTDVAAVEVSPIRRVVLPNGITLLLKRNNATPLVTVQAFFAGGLRAETKSTNGLSMMTAIMLRRGTKTRSAVELARGFDERGGTFGVSSGRNSLYLTSTVLKKDLTFAVDVLSDVIANSTFPEDEFSKVKTLRLAYIARRDDDPMEEAARFFYGNLFENSPYGMTVHGVRESVTNISRQDVVGFYRRTIHPRNMVVAVFGDIDVAQAEALVRQHLGNFEGHGRYRPPSPMPEGPLVDSRTALLVTPKENAVVMVGTPGLKMVDVKDRAVVAVIDTIMSGYGYPGGWLHSELRGRKLVYEVHAYSQTGIEPGAFVAYARCQPSKVKQVAEAILRNVQRMAVSGASKAELELAKTLIVTSEKLQGQTNASQATEAALGELYHVGYDDRERFLEAVEKVTQDDLKTVSRKYLRHYVLAVTTPDEGVAKGVKPDPKIVRRRDVP